MTFVNRALRGTAAALFAALALAACGTDDAPADPREPAAQESAAEFNDADVHFAQMMIPHHEQAVAMADLAQTRAGEEVADLAERIRDAQGPEIEQMTGLLKSWGADTSPEGMEHSDGMMEGMLSEEQMADLESAEGEEFDRLFLEHMIAHHEGAVAMAEAELAEGVDPEARALAQEIVDAQEEEIAEMQGMLGTGPAPDAPSGSPEEHEGH
ncbi:DUF305 domain-containing protein [Nocardiopsis changdeensis]|uniref:DUF305 domain-containing protein n=1 Tax=Nocardiopsis changdeensis TaxID=2831969 RepID=A0ABX8BGJ3_9ACTN|nr:MULTISPECIES: DUF305 domain-containing protein [Nocardiopsis]QUX20433.1 DUF305 domain-containing protein [Nocardiopsis changdeensis]QYX36363.1 DUF305 domain-containing protein [Nocardiopsis sp. MT53]